MLHRSMIAEADGRASLLISGHALLMKVMTNALLMKATTIANSFTCHPAICLELARLFQRVNRSTIKISLI